MAKRSLYMFLVLVALGSFGCADSLYSTAQPLGSGGTGGSTVDAGIDTTPVDPCAGLDGKACADEGATCDATVVCRCDGKWHLPGVNVNCPAPDSGAGGSAGSGGSGGTGGTTVDAGTPPLPQDSWDRYCVSGTVDTVELGCGTTAVAYQTDFLVIGTVAKGDLTADYNHAQYYALGKTDVTTYTSSGKLTLSVCSNEDVRWNCRFQSNTPRNVWYACTYNPYDDGRFPSMTRSANRNGHAESIPEVGNELYDGVNCQN